jgi:hypothetical protein
VSPRGLAGLLVLGLALGAAADEVPGADAVFVGRGVAVLWGTLRGADEARTRVVLRIQRTDPGAPWRLVSVEAVDPFTREREWVRLAASLEAGPGVSVETSRESFVAKPSRRVLFYADAAAVQADRPGLVVTYVSVPDTVPEFGTRAELEEHFRRVLARLPRP